MENILKISNRISKTSEFDDCTFLHATCMCSSDEHDQTIEVSKSEPGREYPGKEGDQTLEVNVDHEDGIIDVVIYSKAFSKDFIYRSYDEKGLELIMYHLKVSWLKIKWILSIIFRGYIEVESNFSLAGPEQVNDYLFAINSAQARIMGKVHNHDLQDEEGC